MNLNSKKLLLLVDLSTYNYELKQTL